MLHIIKQYRKMFLSLLENNFEQSNYGGQESKKPLDIKDINQAATLDEMVKLINNSEIDINNNDHKEFLKKFIKEVARKSGNESSVEESDISDSLFSKERYAFSNVINLLKSLNQFKSVDGKMKGFTDSEIKMLNDFIGETGQVVADASRGVSEVKEDVIRTGEQNSDVTNSVLGIDTSNTTRAEMISQVNRGSLESLISKLSFADLGSLINEISSKSLGGNNPRTYKYTWYGLGNNYTGLSSILEKAGYSVKGALDNKEAAGVVLSLTDVYDTQEKLNKSTKFTDKLGLIFDYNQDGLLDNKVHFYTKEKQFFQAVKTESQFENLLKNLGYQSKEEFNLAFENNYFAARSEFKNRLGNVLSVKDVINPAEMLKNPKALQEFNETKLKAEVELERALNSNEKTKTLPKETKDAIKLQAVGLIAGSAVGAGASFDISGVTNDIIDSLQIGIINGVPGIGIAKNIFKSKEGGFRVDVGAVNLIPMISASGVIKKAEYDEFKKLFPKEIDSKTQVTLTAAVSAVGSAFTLDFSNANEKTKLGIEKAKEKMSGVLDKVFDEIKSGKTFEQSSFKEDASNKAVYEGLTGLYKSNGSNPELVKYLKEGSLKNYERALYQNADGLNYSGVSIGLILLAGYLPVPLVLVQGDYHKTEWKRVLPAGVAEEAKVDEKKDTSKQVEPTPAKTVRENLRSDFEKGTDIDSKLSSFESAFSYRTRFNKGALAFMSPEGSLESRWNGLLQLSRGVKALRDVKLNDFLTTAKTDNEKWLVISTISQYMKKANDFNNGDINSWNENVDKYVKTDKDRRKAFDTMMGFSLESEAEQYYTKLKEAKGNIGETKIKGVGFDATSSKNVETNKTVKGMDTLYTNLSILTVNGEPLLIPITDNAKIEAFKETIKSSKNISEDVKSSLIIGIESGSVELKFYKDPEGFDDRILPVIKRTIPGIDKPLQIYKKQEPQDSQPIELFQPVPQTIRVVGGYEGDKKPNKDEGTPGGGGENESTPGEEGGGDNGGGGNGGGNDSGR